RARVVDNVCLSAQPPADRSVQRLIRRRRWTAPANGWAARPRSGPPSARQRARTDAAPCLPSPPPKGPCGRHRCRYALPVPLLPATLLPPREGALRIAGAPAGSWGGSPRRPGLPLNVGVGLPLSLCGLSSLLG